MNMWSNINDLPIKPIERPNSIPGGQIQLPDETYQDIDIYNPTDQQLIDSGYYPVVYADLLLYQEYGNPVIDDENKTVNYPAVDIDLTVAKVNHKSFITESRYNAEISGIVIDLSVNEYVGVATDRDSQGKINGAYAIAKSDTNYTIPNWKFGEISGGLPTGNITWKSLSNAQIVLMGNAVANHVQSVFSIEKTKYDEIDAVLTVSELRDIVFS